MAYDWIPELLMTDRCRVCLRLLLVAALTVMACALSCRPAWSPDSKRLLFSAVDADGCFVATYERATGSIKRLAPVPGGGDHFNAIWRADGVGAVVLSSSHGDSSIGVAVFEDVDRGVSRTFDIACRYPTQQMANAVLIGDELFVGADGLVRLHIETGSLKRVSMREHEHIAVGSKADGLYYLTMYERESPPEIGTINPESMLRIPSLSKEHPLLRDELAPRLCYSPDGQRMALAHSNGAKIHVVRGGQIEATFALGEEGYVSVNDLGWSPDGTKLFATLGRDVEGGYDWSLYECVVDGGEPVETRLFRSQAVRSAGPPDGCLGLTISPDGKLAALTSAYVPTVISGGAGLYLVDLEAADREVKRVLFPRALPLQLLGADSMRAIAAHWQRSYSEQHASRRLVVGGGGSEAGVLALIGGLTDLAMSPRKLAAEEIEQAKLRNVELREHHVANAVLAVCVHKDNPIESLAFLQLSTMFCSEDLQWSEFGVELPPTLKEVLVACPERRAASFAMFARLVSVRARRLAHSVLELRSDGELLDFVGENENAIAFVGDLEAANKRADIKVVALTRHSGGTPCRPDRELLDSGLYPLMEGAYLYSRMGASRRVALFLGWLKSPRGRKATRLLGLLPVR